MGHLFTSSCHSHCAFQAQVVPMQGYRITPGGVCSGYNMQGTASSSHYDATTTHGHQSVIKGKIAFQDS